MVIWKFPLRLVDEQVIEVPGLINVISAVNQDGNLCLYAEVKPDDPPAKVKVFVVGTGNPAHHVEEALFVDTVMMGPFVWHIYWSLED